MELRKTPLNSVHHAMGGRMVPFAGWEMPVQYTSILQEHAAVRKNAGVFDVSHMGEILVTGENAARFLDSVSCNNVHAIEDGQVQYNAVLNEKCGLVDDITIYRVNPREFFVVSNASNYERVTQHLQSFRETGVEIQDIASTMHQIAIQGPLAEKYLAEYLGTPLDSIAYYRFVDITHKGERLRISRTGYTGEDGFEIYSGIDAGVTIWKDLLAKYGSAGLAACGLGARDLLRLEARYPLYGHELNETWTPVESGIGWIVKPKTIRFPSYQKVLDQKQNGAPSCVLGFLLTEPGVPREGYAVVNARGQEIGKVLSGGHSPGLGGIGTAWLPASSEEIFIQIRDKKIPASVHKKAFVQGTAGKNRNK